MTDKLAVLLHSTRDARVWAQEFLKVLERMADNSEVVDLDLMTGWFANAIGTGEAHANSDHMAELKTTEESLFEIVRDAYRERARLIANLAKHHDSHWNIDPNYPEWKVICIHLDQVDTNGYSTYSTVTWHIAPADMELFPDDLITYEVSDYDGHTTEEKYNRLDKFG